MCQVAGVKYRYFILECEQFMEYQIDRLGVFRYDIQEMPAYFFHFQAF